MCPFSPTRPATKDGDDDDAGLLVGWLANSKIVFALFSYLAERLIAFNRPLEKPQVQASQRLLLSRPAFLTRNAGNQEFHFYLIATLIRFPFFLLRIEASL